ncbi:hypothetical protein BDD12DRAFT_865976 [Trichophaea hybrida]|nr:hypothetical protein BDD12DRAFT_865976 [Trichophaea hybrida]
MPTKERNAISVLTVNPISTRKHHIQISTSGVIDHFPSSGPAVGTNHHLNPYAHIHVAFKPHR